MERLETAIAGLAQLLRKLGLEVVLGTPEGLDASHEEIFDTFQLPYDAAGGLWVKWPEGTDFVDPYMCIDVAVDSTEFDREAELDRHRMYLEVMLEQSDVPLEQEPIGDMNTQLWNYDDGIVETMASLPENGHTLRVYFLGPMNEVDPERDTPWVAIIAEQLASSRSTE